VDNRQLAVFGTIARTGSFTRTAAELHLVQSAVSATIAGLEADLGERLFDRTTRRVDLTPAGLALLPHATAILDAFQAARDAVEAVSGGLSGSIRIGYMTNVTLFDLPHLLGEFSRSHPGVTIQMSPSPTGTAGMADALRAGELDVAFLAATPDDHPDLVVEVLSRSPLGLAVAPDHPLAQRGSVRLAETTDLRFVDFHEGFGTRTRVDDELRRRGLWRTVQIETSNLPDAAALVQHGIGVGFLPRYLTEGDAGLRWLEIEDADLEMCVSVATSRGRAVSAATSRLLALATDLPT
jgi:DNA-binding transcriptional LysR family regulator